MSFDHLKLASDKKALKALASNSAGNEQVLFSCAMTKINRKGKGQNRVLLVTSRHVLNLMPDNYSKVNRCMLVASMHHITTAERGEEFVVHFTDEYDYRFKSPFTLQAVKVLTSAYETLTGQQLQNMVVNDVDALSQQMMTKAAVKKTGSSWGINLMPSSQKSKEAAAPSPRAPPAPPASGGGASSNPFGGGGGAPPPPSSAPPPLSSARSLRMDADDADSDDDGEGFTDLAASSKLASSSGGGAVDVSDGGASPKAAGGAFAKKSKYTIEDFQILKVLGKGAFGKVMLAKAKDSGTIYAMKALSKQTLIEKNEITHTRTERKALEDTHHPFLVHLRFAFQTPSKLYLVMDYCNGGELFYHLKQAGRFPEPQARLYAAEICSALHHLHVLKIIYRDLKPENVLLDSEGHVRITDFGLAKDAMELGDKTNTFCGTPDYLAPEVIKGQGHGRGVDWWSLGTMIYEMLGGLPPFYSENFNVMYERILRAPLEFKPAACFSQDAKTLIDGMLQKEPELRLGSGEADGDDIRKHAWFGPIDWKKLEARQLTPPFKPNVKGELDTSNFDEEFTSQAVESVVPDMALGGGGPAKTTNFEGFTYVDKGHLG